MSPTIILVGADKGGVGKTFTTRILLDLMKARGMKFRAFDGQSPGGELVRFVEGAEVIDIANIEDQMKVFDGVSAGATTVIDLPADRLLSTIQMLDDARLLEEVRAGNMEMVLLHVLGPTLRSIAEITAAAEKISGVRHLVVKNHVSPDSSYFDWDTSETKDILAAMRPMMIELPNMLSRIKESIETAGPEKNGESFVDYLADSAQSKMLKGLLRTWLDKCWAEFDRVGILPKAAAPAQAQPQASWSN
jgi:hypothetical protein